jgi:hypothetical protein
MRDFARRPGDFHAPRGLAGAARTAAVPPQNLAWQRFDVNGTAVAPEYFVRAPQNDQLSQRDRDRKPEKELPSMETAKVDIRKLQLLNDRINQCIDALSQVRLSVHGLSHTAGINPNVPQQTGAFGFQDPRLSMGIGQQQAGFPQQQQGGFPQPFGAGLSHTPPFFAGPQQVGGNPYAAWGGGQAGVNPYMNPYALQFGQLGGLSHSSGFESPDAYLRPAWSDPLLAARIAQTFPYAQFAVPPVVSLY